MIVTIGNLANEVVKYSSKVEIKIVGQTPILTCGLMTKGNVTGVYLYIAQTEENIYTSVSDVFDNNGYRFMPTGLIEMPFKREMDIIHSMYGGRSEYDDSYVSYLKNGDHKSTVQYIHQLLYKYDMIKFNKKSMTNKISNLGFNNRVVRMIDKSFMRLGLKGTFKDLINALMIDKKHIQIIGLKQNDILKLHEKILSKGIDVLINGDLMIDATFRRR